MPHHLDPKESVEPQTRSRSPRKSSSGSFGSKLPLISESSSAEATPTESPAPISKSTSSSLRATAQSFEPLWKPDSPVKELGVQSMKGAYDWYPAEQWDALPEDIRQSIKTMRHFLQQNPNAAAQTLPMRNASPSKRQAQRFWGQMMTPPSSTLNAMADAHMTNPFHANDTTPSSGVHAGQKLKFNAIPGQRNVQWAVEDLDGQEKPINFDSAQASPAMVRKEDCPQCFSPTSDMTSPTSDMPSSATTSNSGHTWSIGAGYATRPYGWNGGDGREISFTGYGPQAEYNARSPVEFQYNADLDWSLEPMLKRPEPKSWPQGQKQWAEYAGYGIMKECRKVDIVEQCDSIPLDDPKMGYCHTCVP